MPAIVGLVLLVFGVLYWWDTNPDSLILTGLVALTLVILTIFFMVSSAQNAKKLAQERAALQRDHVQSIAKTYQDRLAKKRMMLITEDDYGDIDISRWGKEIVSFIEKKIGEMPRDLLMPGEVPTISLQEMVDIVEEVAKKGQDSLPGLSDFDESMNGIEYEHYCAQILRDSGWDAVVSQASNDQGVDIVATKNATKIAIQCKKYSSPVGNKAVQEVLAGKEYSGAELAAVVTNSFFTPSAKQIAKVSGVLLLHHSDIPTIEASIAEAG